MAIYSGEIKVVNGEGSSDTLVPNSILNDDDSTSGFTQDGNNVLKVGDEIIGKKKLIWSGDSYFEKTDNTSALNITIPIPTTISYQNLHKYIIEGYVNSSNAISGVIQNSKNYFITNPFIYCSQKSGPASDTSVRLFGTFTMSPSGGPSFNIESVANVEVRTLSDSIYLSIYDRVAFENDRFVFITSFGKGRYHIVNIYEILE